MNRQDLERLAFLLRSRLALPAALAVPLEAAIGNWARDPAGRSLDYWLALPARAPQASLDFVKIRNGLYQDLAATLTGSTHRRSQIIADNLEMWLAGDAPIASFDAEFRKLLREHRELEPPHLKQTALRAVITPKSCH